MILSGITLVLVAGKIIQQNFFNLILLTICSFYIPAALTSTRADLNLERVENGLSGTGVTTRYWDCCKPSCSWQVSADESGFSTPVRSCAADGVQTMDINAQSGCTDTGDVAYMCNDQQPWVYNSTLSFGWVAASFNGT